MSGYIDDLSVDQTTKLAQLRESMSDVLREKHHDMHLLRFLRARNFNVKKAEELLRNDIEWRKKNNISTILKDVTVPEALDKYWIGGTIGCDKEGAAVVIIPLGSLDPKGLFKSMPSSDSEKLMMYRCQELYEYGKENSKKQGRYIEGVTIIYDLEGLTASLLWKPAVTFFKNMLSMLNLHYPETTKVVYIVRAPSIFPAAYTLVKPVIPEYTRKKIKVLSSNEKKWQKTLLDHIDADVLPKHWGGERVDPDGDPKCPSVLRLGGKVPESYYITSASFDDQQLTKIVIGKGASKELKYYVGVPDSAIRFLFKTDEGEIIYSIARVTKDSQEYIQEKQKVFCQVTPADGTLAADKPGPYIVKFENPSRFKSKALSYQIEILEPDEEEAERESIDDDASV